MGRKKPCLLVKHGFDDEKFMKKAGFIVPGGAQVLIWNNTHKKGKGAFIPCSGLFKI